MAKTMIHNPHLAGDQFYWPAGPVGILLIHGFSATAAEVRPLAEALHKAGYTIAAPLLELRKREQVRPAGAPRGRLEFWQEDFPELAQPEPPR